MDTIQSLQRTISSSRQRCLSFFLKRHDAPQRDNATAQHGSELRTATHVCYGKSAGELRIVFRHDPYPGAAGRQATSRLIPQARQGEVKVASSDRESKRRWRSACESRTRKGPDVGSKQGTPPRTAAKGEVHPVYRITLRIGRIRAEKIFA